MDRAELDWRVDAGPRSLISRETEQHRHGDKERKAQPPLVGVDQRRVQRLLEGAPSRLVAAHEDQNADDGDEHVLKHDAARDGRAADAEQRRHISHPDGECQIRDEQEQHRLPERMAEYLP